MKTHCEHRGRPVRVESCKLCGSKNVPVEVHSCDLRGECTVHARGIRGTDKKLLPICISCPDRTSAGG